MWSRLWNLGLWIVFGLIKATFVGLWVNLHDLDFKFLIITEQLRVQDCFGDMVILCSEL